jgi:hypothetical protein
MTFLMETTDANRQPLRSVMDGKVVMRIGYGLGWVPNREPGEVFLRVVRDEEVMACVHLVDTEWELGQ